MSKKLRFDGENGTGNGLPSWLKAVENKQSRKLFTSPRPKTDNQASYMDAIDENDMVFCSGPAGSGKTHLAVGMAVQGLKDGDFEKIVAVRPVVGVGKTMGYLPGNIEDKVAPFLRPIMDELRKFFTKEEIDKLIAKDILELASLEHIRGRTFTDTFVILDEAQNCIAEEVKVFVTRLGFGSKYVINGDITRDENGVYEQSDLCHPDNLCEFEHQMNNLAGIDRIGMVELTKLDIVRHPLVQKIINKGLGRKK